MLRTIVKKIIQKLTNKKNSFIENFKNKKIIYSFNQIYKLSNTNQRKYKRILLDGGYYNLNYFYRLQLFRTAIKSNIIREYAYIWESNVNLCKTLLNGIGIKNIFFFQVNNIDKEIFLESENITKKIKQNKDIINLKLPYGIPGGFLYDSILKRQKCASINVNDKKLKEYIYKFLYAIKFAKNLINDCKPDIVVLSHCISFQCTPLAWIASKKNIPVIILGNDFDILRLWKILKPKDIYSGIGHPVKKDLKKFSQIKNEKLRSIGEKYILKRIAGHTTDISGRYAFHGKSKKLSKLGINQKNKKIIAIYSACFFDFPHSYGMNRFIDMFDWLKLTIKKASENKKVIWLLKPHPMEKWYGGIKLADILEGELPENIILLPHDYSSKDIINISDGLVTFHGTSAIEYAVIGKPVLVADQGWYHDCGFVLFPKTREDYASLLTESWYEYIDVEKAKYNAELFAGIFFGIPEAQKELIFPDDSNVEFLRKRLPDFVENRKNLISKEINLIKKWINSDSKDYHVFTIENFEKFTMVINK